MKKLTIKFIAILSVVILTFSINTSNASDDLSLDNIAGLTEAQAKIQAYPFMCALVSADNCITVQMPNGDYVTWVGYRTM